MSYNYSIKYRTFDQLLDEVMIDFKNYTLENFIEPQELIKVARRVNYDLGLRVYRTKEVLLEVTHGRVKLPDDFFIFNYGLLCGSFTSTRVLPQGTHIEERLVPKYNEQPAHVDTCAAPIVCGGCNTTPCGCNPSSASVFACNQPQCSCNQTPCACPASPCTDLTYNPLEPFGNVCNKPRVFMNCKGDCYELIQIINTETRTYNQLMPLRMINNAEGIECGCPGLYIKSRDEAWIKNGWLYTNFDCGKVYISYEGGMEDDEGNLLVVDHEMINEYYEYALKSRILENLLMNDEPVQAKLQLVEQRLRVARQNAVNIVNMPNFAEIKQTFEANRRVQYSKYYAMFSSYPSFNYPAHRGLYTS